MFQFKKGTPGYGLLIGICFVVLGVLLLTIGFWKTLLLAVLFAVGFFLGTVENKEQFVKDAANRLIPEKKEKMVNLKDDLAQELDRRRKQAEAAAKEAPAQPEAEQPEAEQPEEEAAAPTEPEADAALQDTAQTVAEEVTAEAEETVDDLADALEEDTEKPENSEE